MTPLLKLSCSLSSKELGPDDARALAEALKTNTALKEIKCVGRVWSLERTCNREGGDDRLTRIDHNGKEKARK